MSIKLIRACQQGPHPVIGVINIGGGNKIEGLIPGLAALNIPGWYRECNFSMTKNGKMIKSFIF